MEIIYIYLLENKNLIYDISITLPYYIMLWT